MRPDAWKIDMLSRVRFSFPSGPWFWRWLGYEFHVRPKVSVLRSEIQRAMRQPRAA